MATTFSSFPNDAVNPDDSKLALESSQKLFELLADKESIQLVVRTGRAPQQEIAIPAAAAKVLADVLMEMAKGNAVTLMPVNAEMTTQQAADVLNVSRPFLIGLLDEGKIPHRKVGTHRRMLYSDVLAYKRDIDDKRLATLAELSAQAQQLDMGY